MDRTALSLARQVDRHPIGVLVAALGVGFVLGGGLGSTTTRRLLGAGLRLGMKYAALPLLQQGFTVLLAEGRSGRDAART